MRTPEDFVAEMLKRKASWSSILATARVIRDGRWREQIRAILVQKGLIPSSHEQELKERDEMIEKQQVEKRRKEKEEWKVKHKPTTGASISVSGRSPTAPIGQTDVPKGEKDGRQENKPPGSVRGSRQKSRGDG